MTPEIFLAFRFHGNFYHSYRGDTPDELGFGKDIRVIRRIIEVLDDCNTRGIPVRATWDFENYFSLEKIMPAYCPDLIQAMQRRVAAGLDEMELMSYNNGLVNAHTAREFEAVMQRAISNPAGSGVQDLFGTNYAPIVRPQEMMFTPAHLSLYPALGVKTISLYYSSIPFTGFSNFIPKLTPYERYNPLTLTYPGIERSMTLLPAYNIGDLANHLTLRRWLKQLRRAQMAMPEPQDFLLLFDQDADDQFWYGFDAPSGVKRHFSTARGLQGLVEDTRGLDYVVFTTPAAYLHDHAPVKTVSFGQDSADGSFDGLSSWAEKWSNHRLFTGLERARLLELQTRRLQAETGLQTQESEAHLAAAFEDRIRLLSTTHFGMAAPVMNLTREGIARDLTRDAVKHAAAAFAAVTAPAPQNTFSLLDYPRGDSTPNVQYVSHPSRGLVRLPLRDSAPTELRLSDSAGNDLPSAILERDGKRELLFVASLAAGERRDFRLEPGTPALQPVVPVRVGNDSLTNEMTCLHFDADGQLDLLEFYGRPVNSEALLSSAVNYAGKTVRVQHWQTVASHTLGIVGVIRQHGSVSIAAGKEVIFERELLLAGGLPYLYASMRVTFPLTPAARFSVGKSRRLQQEWDENWQEIMPCELRPALSGSSDSPLRVWKHNYLDSVTSFSLDYGHYSHNRQLDEANNAITHGWVAVSDGRFGLLVAQSADSASSVAFCPLRTRRRGNHARVRLNPFGSYYGRQYHYPDPDTHLGILMSTVFSGADQIKPYAPSYNGRVHEFSLLIAPYCGDAPQAELQYDAEAFAYPYAVLNDEQMVADPAHRSWSGEGLGETFHPLQPQNG